jgi:hypothetical protein
MSTMSTTGLYEEDLHGTNPANLVTGEIQTLQVPGPDDYYFIIPKAAPYFTDSLKVYNAQTGQLYVENEDYLTGHFFIEAMDSIGRPINGSIRFMKRTIQGQVRLEYRTIGGQWGFSDSAILAELSNRQLNPLIRTWAQIDVLPALFPVLEHNQAVNSLIGSAQILEALEALTAVVEASAEGASQSHLLDFANPHRVTKAQVLLGLVQNYAMATDTEARAGLRDDVYMSSRAVYLQVVDKALTPLNAHIAAQGNVHGLTAADLNLGRVPNFSAASPTEAVDITNNITLLTPYTGALLFEQLSNVPRIDALENLIRDHIADTNNPHQLTPAILGMYSNAEIDQKLADIAGGGGDATTFGGKTPAEWEDSFTSVDDVESVIDKVRIQHEENIALIQTVSLTSSWTPADETAYQGSLIGSATAGYGMYGVINSFNSVNLIQGSDVPQIPNLATLRNAADGWASAEDAVYVIAPNGALRAYGSASVAAPVGWKDDVSFNTANALEAVWATASLVYMRKRGTPANGSNPAIPGDLYMYGAATPLTLVSPSSEGPVTIFTSSQQTYIGETSVLEIADDVFVGRGTAPWVSAINAVITAVSAEIDGIDNTDFIRDIRIGDTHVIITSSVQGDLYVYQINRTGNNVTGVVRVTDPAIFDTHGTLVPIGAITGVKAVSGAYKHFCIVTADDEALFFGDNSQGQCEVDNAAGPFLSIAAGNNFTVTVNTKHQTMFWGNSPDNSMLYGNRGITIEEVTP